MTRMDDHGTLPAHADRLLSRLEGLSGRAVGGTMHMQHVDYATRAHQLAQHLRAALMLSEAHLYPSAMVVLRAALEHHLMDRLILLATRHIVIYTRVKKAHVSVWNAKLAAAKAGDRPDITTWFWDTSGMNVVHRGLHSGRSKKGRGQIISAYYFQVENFDPFTGPKKHAGRLAAPFWERRHVRQWAEESASAWRYVFRHDAVMKALRVNRLLPGLHVPVDVHYHFLSAFAHPTKRGYEAFHGRNYPDRLGSFDHYGSELSLLYVITMAAAELEAFGRMARRKPVLEIPDWDTVSREIREAQAASSYFWFLSGEPQPIDRIDTVHTPRGNTTPKWGRPRLDPAAIRPVRVRYYSDPLDRLVKLHHSFGEMATGLVHRSPFERSDGRF